MMQDTHKQISVSNLSEICYIGAPLGSSAYSSVNGDEKFEVETSNMMHNAG